MAHATTTAAPRLAGVIGFFDDPASLIAATEKVRDARYERFDTFTPYPVHGLEAAQGIKRSPIPYVTFLAGGLGGTLGFSLQYWTSKIDWPVNIGGKPFNSWPAFIPVTFELTVLFAALATFGAMLLLNGLPNITRRIFDSSITRDRFAIVIEAPIVDEDEEYQPKAGCKRFDEREAADFLRSLGAKDVKSVQAEGWF